MSFLLKSRKKKYIKLNNPKTSATNAIINIILPTNYMYFDFFGLYSNYCKYINVMKTIPLVCEKSHDKMINQKILMWLLLLRNEETREDPIKP